MNLTNKNFGNTQGVVQCLQCIGIVSATMFLSSTAEAKDYIAHTTIESRHHQQVPMMLPAGRSHFDVSGIGKMSCIVYQPDTDSLAAHMPEETWIDGRIAVDRCSFDVKFLHPTFVVFFLKSDEVVSGIDRVFDIRITH